MWGKFNRYTTSFSGSDMLVSFLFPNAAPVQVGTASTVGYSLFRQLGQVRTLGRIAPKGRTRGGVTFAGSIVFTIIHQSFIEDIKNAVPYLKDIDKLRPDELPPFDIMITFANELGQSATLIIYGVGFTDETTTFSVEDIFSEDVLTFIAQDIRHMKAGEELISSSSATFNSSTEQIGKFIVGGLHAHQEAADIAKKIAQIEDSMKSRTELAIQKPASQPELIKPTTPQGSLQIQVFDDKKNKVLGARVVITDPDTGSPVSKVTNSDGMASFDNLKVGAPVSYTVSHVGFKNISGNSPTITANATAYRRADLERNPDFGPTAMYVVSPFDRGEKDYIKVKGSRWRDGYFHNDNNAIPAVQFSNNLSGITPIEGYDVTWSYTILKNEITDTTEKVDMAIWMALDGISESGTFPTIKTDQQGKAALNISKVGNISPKSLLRNATDGIRIRFTCKSVSNPNFNKSLYFHIVK